MILYFILFLISSFLCFTVPGIYLLQKSNTKFTFFEKVSFGTVIGLVAFTLLSYILIVLKTSFLILPIIGLIDLLFLKTFRHLKVNFQLPPKKQLLILLIVFIIGIAGQMAIIAPSGLKINGDLVFFSSHGHDGPWHMALMEEIKNSYPLQNPIFAGRRLVNYHFFSDIAPAQFSKYFKLSNLDLYFRFFPFLYSLLLGTTAYFLGKRLGESFTTGVWSVFFVFFTGSFGYIITYIHNRSIGGENIFWATQIQSSVGNPPMIISDILLLTFLYFFLLIISKRDAILFGLCVLLLGSLAEFKIYTSIVVLISLAIVGIIEFIKNKRPYVFLLFLLSSLLSAILYLPNTVSSASFLIWEPWWFIRTMIVADNKLNWLDLELKRQTYLAEHNWKRVIQIELTGFLIFFFGNLGIRSLGLIYLGQSLKKILNNPFMQILFFTSLTSLIMPLLFLQKGVATNTIQFIQSFLLVMGLFAAITITQLQDKIRSIPAKVSFIILITLLSVPTQIGLLREFYNRPPLSKVTNDELQALNFLKQNTSRNNIILTPPYDKNLAIKEAVLPIWAWFDTAYVSAFSERRTYLSDIEQADIMGYDYKIRLANQKLIFESNQTEKVLNKIRESKIDYIYFVKTLRPKADLFKSLEKIYENEQAEIWKVN